MNENSILSDNFLFFIFFIIIIGKLHTHPVSFDPMTSPLNQLLWEKC
jgi:hypothetical protein